MVLGLVVFVALRGSGTAHSHVTEQQVLAMQSSALNRLKFPASFVRVQRGCLKGRCYLVASPASRVTTMVPRLLRLAGMQTPGKLLAAEPVAMLRADHWSTASHDPLVVACKTTDTSAQLPLRTCQDGARIGQTLVNVLIAPYRPCGNATCADPRRTEVVTWSVAFPTGA